MIVLWAGSPYSPVRGLRGHNCHLDGNLSVVHPCSALLDTTGEGGRVYTTSLPLQSRLILSVHGPEILQYCTCVESLYMHIQLIYMFQMEGPFRSHLYDPEIACCQNFAFAFALVPLLKSCFRKQIQVASRLCVIRMQSTEPLFSVQCLIPLEVGRHHFLRRPSDLLRGSGKLLRVV